MKKQFLIEVETKNPWEADEDFRADIIREFASEAAYQTGEMEVGVRVVCVPFASIYVEFYANSERCGGTTPAPWPPKDAPEPMGIPQETAIRPKETPEEWEARKWAENPPPEGYERLNEDELEALPEGVLQRRKAAHWREWSPTRIQPGLRVPEWDRKNFFYVAKREEMV